MLYQRVHWEKVCQAISEGFYIRTHIRAGMFRSINLIDFGGTESSHDMVQAVFSRFALLGHYHKKYLFLAILASYCDSFLLNELWSAAMVLEVDE